MTRYYLIQTTKATDPANNKNVCSQGFKTWEEANQERERRFRESGEKLSITEY